MSGMSVVELATELKWQREHSTDLLVNTSVASMRDTQLCIEDTPRDVSNWGHTQIASSLGIPIAYYTKMREQQPQLLDTNVNQWMKVRQKDQMVRILDHKVRAWLSPAYRRLDNWELAETVLPCFNDHKMDIVSCNVSTDYMHIKALFYEVTGELDVGDVVRAGVSITNSEIGKARLTVSPFMHRLVCKNGAVFNDLAMKQVHLGKRITNDDPLIELYSDETRIADDHAFWMQVKDVVGALSNPSRFQSLVDRVRASKENHIPASKLEAVKDITARVGVDSDSVLNAIIRDGATQFNLGQSISYAAHDVDYDTGHRAEVLAGNILSATPEQFNAILR